MIFPDLKHFNCYIKPGKADFFSRNTWWGNAYKGRRLAPSSILGWTSLPFPGAGGGVRSALKEACLSSCHQNRWSIVSEIQRGYNCNKKSKNPDDCGREGGEETPRYQCVGETHRRGSMDSDRTHRPPAASGTEETVGKLSAAKKYEFVNILILDLKYLVYRLEIGKWDFEIEYWVPNAIVRKQENRHPERYFGTQALYTNAFCTSTSTVWCW